MYTRIYKAAVTCSFAIGFSKTRALLSRFIHFIGLRVRSTWVLGRCSDTEPLWSNYTISCTYYVRDARPDRHVCLSHAYLFTAMCWRLLRNSEIRTRHARRGWIDVGHRLVGGGGGVGWRRGRPRVS